MQTRNDKHLKGIDVSHHQGNIDWKKVKADGVEFVIIKATEGQRTADSKFKQNAEGAKSAGLKIGAYHYAHPDQDPVKEVENFLNVTADVSLDIPGVLDLEVNKGLTKAQVTVFAVKWLTEMERRTGKKPLFYSYTSFIKSYIGKEVAAWPVWIAHYGVTTPGNNSVFDKWEIFQYSDSGRVAGISGNVDMNVMEASFLIGEKEVEQPQKDELSGHWAEKEIRQVIASGKMKGTPDGFKPDQPITRAEIAYMIANGVL